METFEVRIEENSEEEEDFAMYIIHHGQLRQELMTLW